MSSMDASSGLKEAVDEIAEQQPKRKGSPTIDKSLEPHKRQKSSAGPEGNSKTEDFENKGAQRAGDSDYNQHREHKHRHGQSRLHASSPASLAPSPPGSKRVPRSHKHSPSHSGEHEAGEIGTGPSPPRPHPGERARSRPRSHSNREHRHTNGSSKEHRGTSERPPMSPTRGKSGSLREPLTNKSPTPSFLQSGMLAEVRRVALDVQRRKEEEKKKAQEEKDQQSDESLGRAQGKHSPIVWKSSEPGQAHKRTRELSAVERATEELAVSKKSKIDDMDVSPAVKASPSNSESPKNEALDTYRSDSFGNDAPKAPPKSRWLVDDEDVEEEKDEEADLKALNRQEQTDLELDHQLEQEWEESDGEDLSDFQRTRPPINMLHSSRSVDSYKRLNRVSEGTYGVVHRAEEKETHVVCALKQIKMAEEKDGFPLSSIREINILLSLRHKNIVDVSEVVIGRQMDDIYMVMEYMEHDLKNLMEKMDKPFTVAEAKNLMYQLLEGVAYLHANWVLHRDIKTSNILYNNRGQVKICDFGMARQFGSPLRPYTHNVVTLMYRSIELLLGQKQYSTAVDLWSLGCIMAELLTKEVLFKGLYSKKGTGELEQIDAIFKIMGTPTEKEWPGFKDLPGCKQLRIQKYPQTLRSQIPAASTFDPGSGLSELGFDLLQRLLCMDPTARISAEEALKHPWFKELPHPKEMYMMPTFAESRTRDRPAQPRRAQPDPIRNRPAPGGVFA